MKNGKADLSKSEGEIDNSFCILRKMIIEYYSADIINRHRNCPNLSIGHIISKQSVLQY